MDLNNPVLQFFRRQAIAGAYDKGQITVQMENAQVSDQRFILSPARDYNEVDAVLGFLVAAISQHVSGAVNKLMVAIDGDAGLKVRIQAFIPNSCLKDLPVKSRGLEEMMKEYIQSVEEAR